MTQDDQNFVRKYCETYGVEMIPGPGVPCLNGVPIIGEALRELFMSNNCNTQEEILGFIARFTQDGQRPEVTDAFTNGCCYWFAKVLELRFNGEIVYDPVDNHFATRIGDRVYDITGDVTEEFVSAWIPWSTYELGSGARRAIERDCINFIE